MDFKEQFQQYDATLNQLRNQCNESEKQAIVAETNVKNLKEQKDQLINECETFAGVPMAQIPELLNQKTDELTAIMNKLGAININGPITQQTLDAIKELTKEFDIAEPAS